MKATTQNILNWLNDQTIQNQLNQFKETNPNYIVQETTVDESYEFLELNKELLIKSIANNILDEQITFNRRNQILTSLKNISTQLHTMSNFKYNISLPHIVPSSQAFIKEIMNLNDIIENAKLRELLKGFYNYRNETKELLKIRKSFNSLVEEIIKARALNKESEKIFNNLGSISQTLIDNSKELEGENIKTQKIKEDIQVIEEDIKKVTQDIEDKKLKITTFFQNIEEYKQSISQLEIDAKNIISKESTINELITQAERALNLKSAEGISAAFSSYYTDTSKKKTLILWIGGAFLFVVVSIILTILLVTVNNSNGININVIIARIVGVAISITGATFCAKQYVKQKNIIEDYAYKSILAKSIIAFTEEIKKRDDKKVAEYLTKVLDEIHKDPLRSRNIKEDKHIGISAPELIEIILDKFLKTK